MASSAALSIGQLRAFEAVLRHGSFSDAAKELRLTQPTLSRSISKLETSIGSPLLTRRAAGVLPNENGIILNRRVTRFIDQISTALDFSNAGKKIGVERTNKIRSVHIRSLLAVWRLGSFRAAAAELAVTESSLHRPAREIEQLVGINLYKRTAAGVVVTPFGTELARRLAVAISEIDSALDEIGVSTTQRPAIRVGVLPLTPRRFVAAASETALRRDPLRRIQIVEGSYASLSQQVQNGDLDILFGAFPPQELSGALVQERLVADPYVVVARAEHALANKPSLSPQDLRDYGWIYPTASLPRRDVIDTLQKAWGLNASIQIETDSLATTISMLLATERVTVLSKWHVSDGSGLAELCLPPIPHKPRLVGITSRPNWLPTPFQNTFLLLLRKEINEWMAHS